VKKTPTNQSVLPTYGPLFARVLRWLIVASRFESQPVAAPSIDANDNQQLWIADLQFTIEAMSDGYTLWSQERNDPNFVGHFASIAEVEKYPNDHAPGDPRKRQHDVIYGRDQVQPRAAADDR
jgi:hypothetical protein